MKKDLLCYGILCGVGGLLIGLFAKSLNTGLGAILFTIGIVLLIQFYLSK